MNLLWMNTELLHPLERRHERMRTYSLLRELNREHSVTYLTLDDGHAPADAVAQATAPVKLALIQPVVAASLRKTA
jgi:hypothetical protein